VESSDDEEAILALLDEIDCMQPSVQEVKGGENVRDVKKSVSLLSSEIDFMQDDGPTMGGIPAGIPQRLTPRLIPGLPSEPTELLPKLAGLPPEPTAKPTPKPIPKLTPNPTATSVPLHVPEFNDGLLQFLPYPFFPENFAVSDWIRNAHSISSKTKDINWEKLSNISVAKTLASGAKCPLMLVMVHEVSVNARDLGVTLLDESGTISATIQEKVLSTHKIRIHFGLALLVRDSTVFCLNKQTDRHLIVTPNNLVKIYSNVHHV
jgi:hypothetical protein